MSHTTVRAAVGALAVLASDALLAQAPPVVVIDFGTRSVPLDPWSAVGAALLIAGAAFVWARGRTNGFGRLSAWIAIVAAATGTANIAWKLDFAGTAEAAITPTIVTLTTSPAVIQVGTGSAFLEVQNGTGSTITIASVALQNPAQGQEIVEVRGVNCRAGLALAAGAICYIAVETFNPA